MLKITPGALREMFEHCKRDYPHEACGVLAGRGGLAARAVPMRNLHESPSSYEMDPREQLQLQRRLREENLESLAVYHSHVATEAYPSRRDIAQATAVQDFFDGHYVLVTLKEEGAPQARAFRIKDARVEEDELKEESG
ncbi:MAG: M67 family metallopeptidase [Candidatus Omnitrophica bacterium]|nr:M67 family metallopeptidase [Candidatus Omnitrophota bacterium]